jgi:hypothetical protein
MKSCISCILNNEDLLIMANLEVGTLMRMYQQHTGATSTSDTEKPFGNGKSHI